MHSSYRSHSVRDFLYSRAAVRNCNKYLGVRGCRATCTAHSDARAAAVNLQQYDDCELLWLQYRHELSMGKAAAYRVLQDVQRGLLPCDADVLRARALQFTALNDRNGTPALDALRVLNSSRHALRFEPGHVRQSLLQLLQLLPSSNPTQLLLDTLADLDLAPEILALMHQEADAEFKESLGALVTPNVFHHLVQHWRMQHLQQDRREQVQTARGDVSPVPAVQQREWRASDITSNQAAEEQQVAIKPVTGWLASCLRQQLRSLAEVMGPEVVHAAIEATPALLDVQPASVAASLQWLQQKLHLSPVAALLLATAAGQVLLLPRSVLGARYNNLCYLLQHLLGWRLQQVHTLLYNAPQLLSIESARLAANWQVVQQLARQRSLWLEEVAAASQALIITVLCAEQQQLQQLRYAAEARQLQGQGLVQVLRKDYISFLLACPGFRVWRGLVPGDKRRWSLVEDACNVIYSAQAQGMPSGQHGKVLAVDRTGQPVLIQLAELGPSDRLVGKF